MAASWRLTILATLVALSFPYLKERFRVLQIMINNHPSKLQTVSTAPYEIKFGDIVRNCEDGHLDEGAGFVILSCDPGRDKWNTVMGTFIDPSPAGKLYFYNYTDPTAIPVPITFHDFPGGAQDFHPLGIECHAPSSTLFVVNHASSGSTIEIFKLIISTNPPTATHTRTLSHSRIWTPNSLLALTEHDLLMTNDHHFAARTHPWLSKLEPFAGVPGGSVEHLDLRSPHPKATKLASASFANGIARLDDTTIAVAALGAASIYIYALEFDIEQSLAGIVAPSLKFVKDVQIPFFPDNLHVDSAGTLLIAGHAHPPTLDTAIARRLECVGRGGEAVLATEECAMDAPSWVAEWSEAGGRRDLYVGQEYGSACTALRDVRRGVSVVTGLYARGIFVGDA